MPVGANLIESLSVTNFKSLRDVRLALGPLNIFIGANASGKSNLLDSIRVLQGVSYGYSIDEIFHGKTKTKRNEVWEPIRGGLPDAVYSNSQLAASGRGERMDFDVVAGTASYSIGILSTGDIEAESLKHSGETLYDAHTEADAEWTAEPSSDLLGVTLDHTGPQPIRLRLDEGRPALRQLTELEACSSRVRQRLRAFADTLGNVQNLEPSARVLREYSSRRHAARLGERGEDFAALINQISEDPNLRQAYVSWLRELSPEAIDDVKIDEGPRNDYSFSLVIGGKKFTAPVLSDGTLRFAALAAAFFQPDMPELILIEEIENGIHPTRLRLLVDLLKSQTGQRGSPQVIVTTHSPYLLSWLTEEDYKAVFWFSRDGETGETKIRPLSEVPRFLELARRHSAGELFTEGWLETTS